MICLLRNKTSEKSCFLGFFDLFITCYIVNLRQFFFLMKLHIVVSLFSEVLFSLSW